MLLFVSLLARRVCGGASLPSCSYSCCAPCWPLLLLGLQPTVALKATQAFTETLCHGWGGPTQWSVSLAANAANSFDGFRCQPEKDTSFQADLLVFCATFSWIPWIQSLCICQKVLRLRESEPEFQLLQTLKTPDLLCLMW